MNAWIGSLEKSLLRPCVLCGYPSRPFYEIVADASGPTGEAFFECRHCHAQTESLVSDSELHLAWECGIVTRPAWAVADASILMPWQ